MLRALIAVGFMAIGFLLFFCSYMLYEWNQIVGLITFYAIVALILVVEWTVES